MTDKYTLEAVEREKDSLSISPESFYHASVKDDALIFIGDDQVGKAIADLIKDDEEFDRDNNALYMYYNETLLEVVYGDDHAHFVLSHCNSDPDEECYKESDNPGLVRASYAYADDVFERAKEMFSEMKEEYEEILENVDEVIKGFRSGELEFDAKDAYHVVAAIGLSDELSLDGSLQDVVAEFRSMELPESSSLYTDPSFMEKIKDFAVELATDIVHSNLKSEQYPAVTVPGSVEEAGAILHYLEEQKVDGYAGDPLGSAYVDIRIDPRIEVRIFREYTDKVVQHMLGAYNPDAINTLEKMQALVLEKVYAADELREGSGFIETQFPRRQEGVSQVAPHRAIIPTLEMTFLNVKEGNATVNDYADLAKSRDLTGVYSSELKSYLAIMHPEVARLAVVREKLDLSSASRTLMGLIDGTAAGKSALASLKEAVAERVPEPTKALGAFRKTLYPENPAPQGPQIR